jgi:hypothetical protein
VIRGALLREFPAPTLPNRYSVVARDSIAGQRRAAGGLAYDNS